MAFRKLLAKALIYNRYVTSDGPVEEACRGPKRWLVDHTLGTAPPHARWWTGGEWDTSAKNKYQQYICGTPGCKKQVWTYCKCSPGTWMCADCLLNHVVDGVMNCQSSHWIQCGFVCIFL
jgi:hypothetical protein